MKLFLFICVSLTFASAAFCEPLYRATYPDNGVSLEKRVIDTYKAALGAREDNQIKQVIAQLQSNLHGFGKVRTPSKDDLLLFSAGESTPSAHDSSRQIKNGKFLLAIPTTAVGLGVVNEHRDILVVYYSVQVKKKVEIIIQNFADLVDRLNPDEAAQRD